MIAPCCKCHKRHGRDHDDGSIGDGIIVKPNAVRLTRAFVLMASLLAGAATAASPPLKVAAPGIATANKVQDAHGMYYKSRGLFAIVQEDDGTRRTQTVNETAIIEGEVLHDEDHEEDEAHEGET
jgi:hypothetical protein